MCGRFTLRTTPAELCDFFGVPLPADEIQPRFNVAPTQQVSAVIQSDRRTWEQFRWGLVPFWAKDLSIGNRLINARGETLAEKPAFRAAYKKRRCLVMADGFYEWEKTKKGKQPHYFSMADESPLAFAGLWESWKNEAKETVRTCTVVTTTANQLLAPYHDRMPVILEPDSFETWLDPDFYEKETLQKLVRPFAAEEMTSRQVSKLVNNVKNELPECLDDDSENLLF